MSDVHLPTGSRDPHDADHVLRAFRYQLLQSINYWMDLRDDEELWLECGEDLRVTSEGQILDVQVKHSETARGPSSISLRTAGLRDSILRFWERSDGGTRPHLLTFIARGGPAREAGSDLPRGKSGIEYWTTIVQRGATEPLRILLNEVYRDTSIGTWLSTNPSDAELRHRLLTRIRFALTAKDDALLEMVLRERIAAYYLDKQDLASRADQGFALLLARAFEVASAPEISKRRLTRVALHAALEEAIPRLGERAQAILRGGTVVDDTPAHVALAVSKLRTRPGVIDRRQVVARLDMQVGGRPLIWLTGSSGVGKSILAALLARTRGGHWLVCDLRPFLSAGDERGVFAVWRELMAVMNRGDPPAGVILDDLSLRGTELLKMRIAGLADALASRGGQVIVTSNFSPSGALQLDLGMMSGAIVEAPYFTEEEVQQLVSEAPGPPSNLLGAWAKLIHLTTGVGHPLLTVAKIANLRKRNWPRDALLEDLDGRPGTGIAEARREARLRLIEELTSPEERQLLSRLSVPFMKFDDALALKLGNVEPPVANPGDALALLKGSWIEPLADGYLRLSPLITDLNVEVSAEDAIKWRRCASEHWMSNRVLNETTLPLAFWNAFLGKHLFILLKLGTVILTLSQEKLRATAMILSPLGSMRTDGPLWPDDPMVAAMLRLVQIRVADALEDDALAANAARAWLQEVEAVPDRKMRSLMIVSSPMHFFDLEHVRLPPDLQLRFVSRLSGAIAESLQSDDRQIQEALSRRSTMLPEGIDLPGYFVTRMLMLARDSRDFEEYVSALNDIDPSERHIWLEEADRVLEGPIWIHSPWAKDQLSESDLAATLERYDRASAVIATWKEPQLDVEMIVAKSTLLDEGLDCPAEAIRVVDDAISTIGRLPVLVRQKYKVLSRRGENEQAAQLFLEVEAGLENLHPFERAMANRNGGIVCARTGRFDAAERAFTSARAILKARGTNSELQAGLTLELALVSAAKRKRPDSLRLLADAFEEIEKFVATATRQGQRSLRFACAMAPMLGTELRETFSDSIPSIIEFGVPSQPESTEDPTPIDLPSLKNAWMMLELAESECGFDVGIAARTRARIPAYEYDLTFAMWSARARYNNALSRRDIESAVALVEPMVEASIRLLASKSRVQEGTRLEMRRTAIVGIILYHGLVDAWTDETIGRLKSAIGSMRDDDPAIDALLEASQSPSLDTSGSSLMVHCTLMGSFPNEQELNPTKRCVRDMYLVQAAADSLARHILEPFVVERITRGWRDVVDNQRFNLRNPRESVPAIESALASLTEIRFRAAKEFFAAATAAVGITLPAGWDPFLERLQLHGTSR